MDVREVAQAVCRMASDFYRLGNVSMLDLTKASGYLEDPSSVRERELFNALRTEPELVESWLIHSDNKRVRCGWAFVRSRSEWRVIFPNGRKYKSFADRLEACAFFIKQEVEAFRSSIGA